jgi:hypothetical protein
MPNSFFVNRSRSRGNYRLINSHYHYVEGGTVVDYDFVIPQWTLIDDISDVKGKKRRSDGRYPPSCVYHNRVTLNAKALSAGTSIYGGQVSVSGLLYPIIDLPSLSSIIPMPSEDLIAAQSEEAFFQFSQQVPVEVSFANFLYELREIGSLLPKLEHSAAKTVSGGYLNFSFGWKPFVGDLQKLASLVSSVTARIQHLKDTYGKRTRLHKSFVDCVEVPVIRPYHEPDTTYGKFPIYLVAHQTNTSVNGFLFHKLQGLDSMGGLLRAFAAALGLNNPLQTFWEAIPYSFVVDWFGKIGTRLTALSANPFQGQWEVMDLTYSIKSSSIYRCYQRESLLGANGIWAEIGSLRYDRFVRYNYLPIDLASFNLASLSPQQLALYLALLLK